MMNYKIDITWHLADLEYRNSRLTQLNEYLERSNNYSQPDPQINAYWKHAIDREALGIEKCESFIKSMEVIS